MARSFTLVGSIVLSSLTFAIGCAAPAGDDDVSSDQDAITQPQHAAKVKACLAAQDKALDRAGAQSEMNQAVYGAANCIAKANDGTIARIEKNAKQIQSSSVGQVKAQIQAYRAASADACEVIGDSGDSAGGSLGRLELGECHRDREATLAALIDAYVDLGGEAIALPEDRTAFPACYADFDKTPESANDLELREAAYGLAKCGAEAADALVPYIAMRTVETFPDRSLTDVTAKATAAFAKMHEATATVCRTLADASDSRGGTLARLYDASCQTDGAAQLVKLAKGFAE